MKRWLWQFLSSLLNVFFPNKTFLSLRFGERLFLPFNKDWPCDFLWLTVWESNRVASLSPASRGCPGSVLAFLEIRCYIKKPKIAVEDIIRRELTCTGSWPQPVANNIGEATQGQWADLPTDHSSMNESSRHHKEQRLNPACVVNPQCSEWLFFLTTLGVVVKHSEINNTDAKLYN